MGLEIVGADFPPPDYASAVHRRWNPLARPLAAWRVSKSTTDCDLHNVLPRVLPYPVSVARPGPYVAETFTLAVDQEYVVVEVEQPRGT